MTGPEHYRKAEQLAAQANGPGNTSQSSRDLLMAAQLHATLALAAATALRSGGGIGQPWDDEKEWRKAAATVRY